MIRTHLAALALLAAAAAAQAQTGRTVTYYLQNPDKRAQKLRECWDDEEVARGPDCANAQRAADRAGTEPRRPAPPPRTPNQMLTSPSYYAENRVARDIMLDRCSRGSAAPADCRAAVASLRQR